MTTSAREGASASGFPDAALPASFHAADRTAIRSQRQYLWLVGANLGLLVASAVSTAFESGEVDAQRIQAAGAALFFFASLTTTGLVAQLAPDKDWFGARAVAESTKTLAWK